MLTFNLIWPTFHGIRVYRQYSYYYLRIDNSDLHMERLFKELSRDIKHIYNYIVNLLIGCRLEMKIRFFHSYFFNKDISVNINLSNFQQP